LKIIRAEKAGFCFGVKRALDMAERTAQSSTTASLGPLIHNQQVVEKMEKQGVRVVGAVEEAQQGDTLIIRSHGVPPEVYQKAGGNQIQVVDATCPFVQKAQRLAEQASKEAVKKTFNLASGSTWVPISRPSITTPPRFAS